MRYHWGLAVGHVYTHLSKLADDSTSHKSKSQSTNNDVPDHWISLEHYSSAAVDVDLLNNRDGGEGIMESSDDEEFWRHWDELASDEDENLDSDSVVYAMYKSDGDRDSHGDEGSDFDFYEFY